MRHEIYDLKLGMWMHDGSHTVGEDLFCTVDGETVDMYKQVFKKIFELKNQNNRSNMMLKVLPDVNQQIVE